MTAAAQVLDSMRALDVSMHIDEEANPALDWVVISKNGKFFYKRIGKSLRLFPLLKPESMREQAALLKGGNSGRIMARNQYDPGLIDGQLM